MVGIVSFIFRDSQGISFALPIDRAIARFGEHLTSKPARPSPPEQVPAAPRAVSSAKRIKASTR